MTKPIKSVTEDTHRNKLDKSVVPQEFNREKLKVAEIDPDAQSKWKNMRHSKDTEEENAPPPPPSPMQTMGTSSSQTYEGNTVSSSQPTTQTTAYVPPPTGQEETLPTSYDFYHQQQDIAPLPQQSSQDQEENATDKTTQTDQKEQKLAKTWKKSIEKKTIKSAKKAVTQEKNLPIEKQKTDEKPLLPKTKKEKTETETTKPLAKESTEKPLIKKTTEKPIETEISSTKKEPQPITEKKEKKTENQEKVIAQPTSLILSPEIQSQAFEATKSVSSYLDPKVEALYQNMVGAIIQTKNKGIEKTEVLLNQPNLKASQFYGSKITLTRYSTNPYSYNITLSTPNPKALTQFNNHLDRLRSALNQLQNIQGKFDFKVGRLEAHFISDKKEQFLFKRKEAAGEKDTESGKDQQK